MKRIKLIVNIILGSLSLLSFNENIKALYLNAIGMASFLLLVYLNDMFSNENSEIYK